MIDTMRWENGKLILLDQTKLPQATELITCEADEDHSHFQRRRRRGRRGRSDIPRY